MTLPEQAADLLGARREMLLPEHPIHVEVDRPDVARTAGDETEFLEAAIGDQQSDDDRRR